MARKVLGMNFTVLALTLAVGVDANEPVRIEIQQDPTRVQVIARVPKDSELHEGEISRKAGERKLRLTLVDERGQSGPPILAHYRRQGELLALVPRYALAHGQRYRATRLGSEPITVEYVVPKRKPTAPAVVQQVYPSTSQLPANHLKFYIHFSKPMRQGRAIFDRIHLHNADGKPVTDPWRRTELWTADARRLTLWIHPGRVKRGVNLREQIGPVLEAGKSYSLVVGPDVQDAEGQPLAAAYTKRFTAMESDQLRPLPQNWKLQTPRPGSQEALIVQFGEPMDRPLLDRFLKVFDDQRRLVKGSSAVGPLETAWHFTPVEAWNDETYELATSSLLEDLAGNTPQRVFDTDLDVAQPEEAELSVRFHPAKLQ